MSRRRKPQPRRRERRDRARPISTGEAYRVLLAGALPPIHDDARGYRGDIAGPGGPHDRDAVIVAVDDAVLLDATEVCTVQVGRNGNLDETAIYLLAMGRINKTTDRARIGFILNTDGAAALISELLAVADRFGVDLLRDLVDRLITLGRDGNLSLTWLRGALDVAAETIDPEGN